MRGTFGLALVFGASVLALYVLSGRVPFAASSSVGVANGGAATSGPIQNPLAASQQAHRGA